MRLKSLSDWNKGFITFEGRELKFLEHSIIKFENWEKALIGDGTLEPPEGSIYSTTLLKPLLFLTKFFDQKTFESSFHSSIIDLNRKVSSIGI